MTDTMHIYCDESCHLENDGMKAMVLGALWCPADQRKSLSRKIKALKAEHGLPTSFEIKWVKVSPGKLPFYQGSMPFPVGIDFSTNMTVAPVVAGDGRHQGVLR